MPGTIPRIAAVVNSDYVSLFLTFTILFTCWDKEGRVIIPSMKTSMETQGFGKCLWALVLAVVGSAALAAGADLPASWRLASKELVVENGLVRRTIDCTDGHVRGASYELIGASGFMHAESPEFSLQVDGRTYSGLDTWRDVRTSVRNVGEGKETQVSFLSADGRFRIGLAYTTYPGLPLVRKTLEVTNLGESDIKVEAVNVEDFLLDLLAAHTQVHRYYARYRTPAPFVGNWDDPLVLAYDLRQGRGMAVGNETIGVLKRTAVFTDGRTLQVGTTTPGQPYPFRRWLKKGQSWRSAAVFTAPYAAADAGRIVDSTVQDYVRKHMGARVERISHKPMFIYNSYLPFGPNMNEKLLLDVAESAAACGADVFAIDDGWQINVSQLEGAESLAMDGLTPHGDWAVDPAKFPRGLKPLFDRVRELGMKPGIWIALACADTLSRPYREHPEWLVRDANGRLANLHGGGLRTVTACMGTDWYGQIRDTILRLVREYGLGYVKLDLAAVTSAYVFDVKWSGCYATNHPGHRDWEESLGAISSRCMDLFDELHREAPDLYIDCTYETAGKPQLMDYGIAKHADGNWLSNIMEPGAGGALQMRNFAWARCPALPPASLLIGNLLMDGPDHLLAFKSLAGTLPVMLGDLRRLTEGERAEFKAWADWLRGVEARHGYMSFRQNLPGFGEPQEGAWDGFARINTETRSGGLVGVFRQNAAESARQVVVPGLDLQSRYEVRKAPSGEVVLEASGEGLATRGFRVSLESVCDGALFEIIRTIMEDKWCAK